jgi:glycosyltransferase involved in cell wall biosynthesis
MADGLARTIASVAVQKFGSREYIVIDGGSRDGSLALLHDNARLITRCVSEPDRGIYDAMNKGVAMARGQWVLFLNSGDSFASSDALSSMFAAEEPNDDILYGNSIVRYRGGAKRSATAADANKLPFGMICSHQALFARRDLLVTTPFRIGKIRSDYEFLLACWKSGRRFRRVDVLVAEVEAGGLSDRKRVPALRERAALLREMGLLRPAVIVNLGISFFWAVVAPPVKGLLSERATDVFRKLKLSVFGARSGRG